MRVVSLVFTALLLLASRGFAQTTFATITGSVTDPTGLAAPAAAWIPRARGGAGWA